MFRKKNPTFAFTYLLKSPKSQKQSKSYKRKDSIWKYKENIHQWCPFWTASAVKDFMFRMKKSRMFAGINRRKKKSKKEFLFSVYNMDRRKPWMWYFPLKWSSLEMTLSQRLWTHTKKKRYQKETKKKLKNCALIRSASMHHHQINHRTLFYHKNCAFAMSMCITSIIYLLLYGYTMITYLLIMMINTTTTICIQKHAYHIYVKSSLRNGKLPPKIYLSRILQKKKILRCSTHGFTNSQFLLNSDFGIGNWWNHAVSSS